MFSTRRSGAGLQVRQRVLHQEHRSAQVHLVGLRPRFGCHLAQRLGQRVRGVVHHDIDAAELVDGPLHEGTEIVDVAKVGGHADGLAPETAQVLGCPLAGVGFAAGHHHICAGQHEALCQREADASGAAGDDDRAAGHVEQVVKRFAIHAAQ
jgi:hypothetical protein